MRSSAGLERRRARCGWLALPEGNATGFALFEFGISAKWLELLKQIAPSVTRMRADKPHRSRRVAIRDCLRCNLAVDRRRHRNQSPWLWLGVAPLRRIYKATSRNLAEAYHVATLV